MFDLYERLAPGRPRTARTDEILQLRAKGFTYGQISLKTLIPRSTISTICTRDNSCHLCNPFPCVGKHDNKTQKSS